MTTIKIKDYSIEFPYQTPYDIQISYMEKVLSCLDGKTHGVLESPTGTGKTLCLFAPVAAWIKRKQEICTEDHVKAEPDSLSAGNEHLTLEEKIARWAWKKKGKVWYTARTHSQIAQTVAEVRRCNIKGLHVRVMGARDQLCINQAVLDEKDSYVKTVKCKELTKNKGCRFYNKLNYEKDSIKFYQAGEVMDIEDMVAAGKSCGICPYFMAKKGSESADIVLLPYNYIIDKDSREANGFSLNEDVVIFDEGHNVPSTCEESYEFTLTSMDVALGIKNTKELMQHLSKMAETASTGEEEMDLASHAQCSMFVLDMLQRLEAGLDKLPMSNDLLPVSSLYEFFDNAGLNGETSHKLLDGIEGFKKDSVNLALSGSTLSTFYLIEKMANVVFGSTVKVFEKDVIERSFKCGITVDSDRAAKSKKLSLFCFNPTFGIKSLLQLGVQSIIITSGTLSPLRTFIHELDLPKPVTLENGHIAKKAQVPFAILGTGVNNVKMDGAFKNRNEPAYVFSLGMTLTNLISSVPDGVLLLFSSYSMMQNLKDSWENEHGVWTRLNALKRVFVEPRGKNEFINCMENYRRAVDAGNGAVLMGVLRGKISEGMDFKDQYCRAVFIVGVPFPPVHDPRVKGKERYAESLTVCNADSKRTEKLYNNSFMSVEAMKATNQAIGRVIRHGGDYGAIILVDYRFAWPRLYQNISSWIRDPVAREKNFPETKKMLREFFKIVSQNMLGVPELRSQRVDSNGCPVAGYVSYEEYDHKRAVRTPAPWIAAPGSELSATTAARSKIGRSTVQYEDDSPEDDILSNYNGLSAAAPLQQHQSKQNSFFDALDSPVSSGIGYREHEVSDLVRGKRKTCEQGDQAAKSPCLGTSTDSPSLLGGSGRRLVRLRVKPMLPVEETLESEVVQVRPTTDQPAGSTDYLMSIAGDHKNKRTNQEAVKTQLINYFQTVKETLSEDSNKVFKSCAWRYMKGETNLTDTLHCLDQLLVTASSRSLLPGFHICIKSKDQESWAKALRSRTSFAP